MRTLFIVRHGQTEWNVAGRMQGRMDSPLTGQGKSQARANGLLLQRLGGVQVVWCSPAGRTRQTAALLNTELRAPVNFADALQERDCGLWSGLTLDEIATRFPQDWDQRQRDPFRHQPPSGENMPDMQARCAGFLDEILQHDWCAAALVTHGVLSKVILMHYLGLSEQQAVALKHPNELVYRLSFTDDEIQPDYFIHGGAACSGLLWPD